MASAALAHRDASTSDAAAQRNLRSARLACFGLILGERASKRTVFPDALRLEAVMDGSMP